MTDWSARIVDFTAFLRAKGWRQPLVFRGLLVLVVGIAGGCPAADNDNHRRP